MRSAAARRTTTGLRTRRGGKDGRPGGLKDLVPDGVQVVGVEGRGAFARRPRAGAGVCCCWREAGEREEGDFRRSETAWPWDFREGVTTPPPVGLRGCGGEVAGCGETRGGSERRHLLTGTAAGLVVGGRACAHASAGGELGGQRWARTGGRTDGKLEGAVDGQAGRQRRMGAGGGRRRAPHARSREDGKGSARRSPRPGRPSSRCVALLVPSLFGGPSSRALFRRGHLAGSRGAVQAVDDADIASSPLLTQGGGSSRLIFSFPPIAHARSELTRACCWKRRRPSSPSVRARARA